MCALSQVTTQNGCLSQTLLRVGAVSLVEANYTDTRTV